MMFFVESCLHMSSLNSPYYDECPFLVFEKIKELTVLDPNSIQIEIERINSCLKRQAENIKAEEAVCDNWYSETYENETEFRKDIIEATGDNDEKVSLDILNKLIIKYVSKSTVTFIKYTDNLHPEEERAFLSTDLGTVSKLEIKYLIKYAHLYLRKGEMKSLLFESSFYNGTTLLLSLLEILFKLNFSCLKRLRFGSGDDSCISDEKRGLLIDSIRRNTLVTSNLFGNGIIVKNFMDKYIPFWDKIQGVNITGSIVPFLCNEISKMNHQVYTPTYYSIDTKNKEMRRRYSNTVCKKYECLVSLFPVSDGSVFVLCLNETLDEQVHVKNFISSNKNVETPIALVKFLDDDDDQVFYDVVGIVKGTDIDCPVWDMNDLDRVAGEIKDYLSKDNIGVSINKEERSKGYSYTITMSHVIPSSLNEEGKKNYALKYLSFYDVEVYKTSPEHVFTHHVGMTRGWIEKSKETDYPEFHLDGSCLWSVMEMRSPNYSYFAGKKSTPLDVMAKYSFRGYGLPHNLKFLDREVGNYTDEYLKIPYGYSSYQ